MYHDNARGFILLEHILPRSRRWVSHARLSDISQSVVMLTNLNCICSPYGTFFTDMTRYRTVLLVSKAYPRLISETQVQFTDHFITTQQPTVCRRKWFYVLHGCPGRCKALPRDFSLSILTYAVVLWPLDSGPSCQMWSWSYQAYPCGLEFKGSR